MYPITSHQICVGRGGGSFKTWEQITRELNHRVIDVAKIDIEGHEPAVLAELRHDIPLPRQVSEATAACHTASACVFGHSCPLKDL